MGTKLEVRLSDPQKSRLAKEADSRGMTMTQLVKSQLGVLLGPTEPDPVKEAPEPVTLPGPGEAPHSGPTPGIVVQTIGLDRWLAGRTGQPEALCRRMRLAGRVTVDGRISQDDQVRDTVLDTVRLDGEPV